MKPHKYGRNWPHVPLLIFTLFRNLLNGWSIALQDYSHAKILVDKALNQDNMFSEDEKKSLLHRLKRLNSKLVTT